jgi:hypothetical protein
MKTYRGIVAVVLVLALCLPVMAASAQTRFASITLTNATPNPVLVGSETTFELVIAVENIMPGAAGADVYLSYNPALVEPPISPQVAAEARPDFFGPSTVGFIEVLTADKCPGGANPCVHVVVAGPPQVTQTGVAARFHFKGKAEGLACFTVLQSSLVDADGYQVEHTMATQQCVTIVFEGKIRGVVLRQGVVANPNPGGGTLACSSVSARKESGTYGPVYTDTSGAFLLERLPTGIYTVRAVYSGYLASEKTGVSVSIATPDVNIFTTTLRGGDVNEVNGVIGDNAINILDIGTVISKFGQANVAVKSASTGCAGQDFVADINDDGLVNISDLAIVAGNWGLVGPRPWQ